MRKKAILQRRGISESIYGLSDVHSNMCLSLDVITGLAHESINNVIIDTINTADDCEKSQIVVNCISRIACNIINVIKVAWK